jgi:Flp pilus assembly pilin Flp
MMHKELKMKNYWRYLLAAVLVLALVAVAAIVALGVLGGGISDTLNNVGDTISGAGS